jgi:hypothetical protein
MLDDAVKSILTFAFIRARPLGTQVGLIDYLLGVIDSVNGG